MADGSLVLALLAVAGCATAPVPVAPTPDLPPLPRSSIVAVLAHRSELQLTDDQVAALEQADAELQPKLIRLRTEGALAPPPPVGPGPGPGPGPAGGGPPVGGPGTMPGGRPGVPGNVPGSPMTGVPGAPGTAGGPPGGGPPGGAPRRNLAREQEALEGRLDAADTAAFLKAEPVFTAAQRERAREIANGYREQLFDRRELLRGR